MEWIECTVCEIFTFKLYRPTVTLKLRFRITQGHRKRHYSIEHIGYELIFIFLSKYASIYYRFQDIAAYWLKIAIPPVVFGALVRGDTIRFTQQSLVMKTIESRAYQIVKEFR